MDILCDKNEEFLQASGNGPQRGISLGEYTAAHLPNNKLSLLLVIIFKTNLSSIFFSMANCNLCIQIKSFKIR